LRAVLNTTIALLFLAGLVAAALFFAVRYYRAHPLSGGLASNEAVVTIPEGITAEEIDALLAARHITTSGSFAALVKSEKKEGYLFPDTYRFFTDSDPHLVLKTLLDTFDKKAAPLFEVSTTQGTTTMPRGSIKENIIIASILEREVPEFNDRQIVAGILKKRLAAGMALQVDATVCYAKKLAEDAAAATREKVAAAASPSEILKQKQTEKTFSCYPLTPLDFKIDSPYNTYLYTSLPPGPIGNPGVDALRATVQAQQSPYWYYLTDPATGRTIFSKTIKEQNEARARYLTGS